MGGGALLKGERQLGSSGRKARCRRGRSDTGQKTDRQTDIAAAVLLVAAALIAAILLHLVSMQGSRMEQRLADENRI